MADKGALDQDPATAGEIIGPHRLNVSEMDDEKKYDQAKDDRRKRLDEFVKRAGDIAREYVNQGKFITSEEHFPEFKKGLIQIAEELEIDVETSVARLRRVRPARKGKRKKSGGQRFAVPTGIVKYVDDALSIRRFVEEGLSKDFDVEERKDIMVFSRRRGDILEEYRFDKDVIDVKGERHIPSPAGMRRDLLSTIKLLHEKKTNPFSFTWKEKEQALGYSDDQIKNMGGREIRRDRQAFIQLSEMRFKRFKIDKDGEKRLQILAHPSPYEMIWLPTDPGGQFAVLLQERYIKGLDPKTHELKPGDYKMVSQNPYRGQYVEERAFEFLERDVRGRSIEIKAETILRDKLKVSADYWKRPGKCADWIDQWLQVAKNEGYAFEIENQYKAAGGAIRKTGNKAVIDTLKKRDLAEIRELFIPKRTAGQDESKPKKIHDETLLGDCRKWKITFFSPVKPQHELTEDGKLLAKAVTAWLYDANDFGIKNPRERTLRQIESYIRHLDVDPVAAIYKDVRDSPTLFSVDEDGRNINGAARLWKALKALRAEKFK